MTLSRRWSSVWVRWTTSRFASAWICAGVGGGAAVVTGVAGRRAGRAAAGFCACTLMCGSCVPPGGTAAGGGSERVCCGGVAPGGATGGPAFCADVAPTAATIAHTEPPRLNSLRTDLNTLPPQISTVRRHQRNSTAAEFAVMNEANKKLQGQRKTLQPRYVVRFDLNYLMKYGLGFDGEPTKQIVYGG
jgi:hypothetical protein